jgi:hypothetical protein
MDAAIRLYNRCRNQQITGSDTGTKGAGDTETQKQITLVFAQSPGQRLGPVGRYAGDQYIQI